MGMRRRILLLWAAGAFALGGRAGLPAAEAACPSSPLVAILTSPLASEGNVPLNAVIDIVVFADPMPADVLTQFSLWLDAATFVVTSAVRFDSNTAAYMTTVRLTPGAFLYPNRMYEIRQGTVPLARFSTGSLPDSTAPPPLTGAAASVNTFDSHPDGGSDCITDRIRLVRLSVPSSTKPVVYSIREGAQVITSFDSNLTGSFYCSGQPHWQGDTSWVVSSGQHTVQLSAIDRAGNSSASVDVSFNASCAGADGGSPDGGGGTGSNPGNDSTVPVQSTGCSCGTGTSAAIALAGFATILRARRRKRASDPAETSTEL